MRKFNIYTFSFDNPVKIGELTEDDNGVSGDFYPVDMQLDFIEQMGKEKFETIDDFFETPFSRMFSRLLVYEVDKDGREFQLDDEFDGKGKPTGKVVKRYRIMANGEQQ